MAPYRNIKQLTSPVFKFNMVLSRYLKFNSIKLLLLTIAAFVMIFSVHHGSYKNSLRYTMIAEGNISVAIGEIWLNGYTALKDIIIKNEAVEAGRIRPAHWLAHQTPFLFTLIRNGDIIAKDDDKRLAHRINGDLQTHTIVLLFFFTLSVVFMAYVLLAISESWFSCFLFIIITSGSLTISQNLLRNYCDSGEIFQLFFISLYIFCFLNAWKTTGINRYFFEALSIFSLLFAYATKETTLAILPLVIIIFLYINFRDYYDNKSNRSMLLRGLGWHLFFSTTLLSAIYFYKSKGYAENYVVESNYYLRIQTVPDYFRLGFDIGDLLLLGCVSFLLIILIKIFLLKKTSLSISYKKYFYSDKIFFTLMAFGGCLVFILINLPWQLMTSKYFIVSYFFLSLGLSSLFGCISNFMLLFPLKFAPAIFIIFATFLSIKEVLSAYNIINDYYISEYGYIDSIPIISHDIAKDAFKSHSIKSTIIGNPLQDGGLSFLRQINLLYGINISQEGTIISSIKAPERNYFHTVKGAPLAQLDFYEKLGHVLPQGLDTLYLYDHLHDSHTRALLEDQSFVETHIVSDKTQDFVRKFLKLSKDPHQNTQSLLKRFFLLSTTVLMPYDKIHHSVAKLITHNLKLQSDSNELTKLQALNDDAYFFLPLINAQEMHPSVLRLILTSPHNTTISLYHISPSGKSYNEFCKQSRLLKVGDNELYFFLPAEYLRGPLRIDPGEISGEYFLRHLELRTISPATMAAP